MIGLYNYINYTNQTLLNSKHNHLQDFSTNRPSFILIDGSSFRDAYEITTTVAHTDTHTYKLRVAFHVLQSDKLRVKTLPHTSQFINTFGQEKNP